MVSIAGGCKLWSEVVCYDLSWKSCGTQFEVLVFLLPLVGYDMVLGMQWLRELRLIQLDYKNLTMDFMLKGKVAHLIAAHAGKSRIISDEKC